MKSETIAQLESFEKSLKELRKEVKKLKTERVSKKSLYGQAKELATTWFNTLESLIRRFDIEEDKIAKMSEQMAYLLRLSRPNNRKSSYLKILDEVSKGFKDRWILPIQTQTVISSGKNDSLEILLKKIDNSDEVEYLEEAIDCARAGFYRAAIVMGWCAVISRFQDKIERLGFSNFNAASVKVKNKTSGKFKRWNKEFKVTNRSELQSVFDTDLIVVFEGGLDLLDSNQGKRLEVLFDYRNNSAHPGKAPIDEPHLLAFFHDIVEIVLSNPNFKL